LQLYFTVIIIIIVSRFSLHSHCWLACKCSAPQF